MRALCLVLLLALALPASAAAAPGEPRIVGGAPVAIEDFPYQVAVVVSVGGGRSTRCGGAILDPSRVVTAAHCLRDPDTDAPVQAGAVQVRAGSARIADLAAVQQRREAAAYTAHPDYDGTYADAALLTLAAPLDLSGPRARGIALADAGDADVMLPGRPATVSGWGTTSAGGPPSSILRAVDVPLVSDAACAAAYGPFRAASLLCAGDLVDGGEDSCQGDSGGPLVVRSGGTPKLVGIVSSGAGCADPDCPGVYTEVLDAPVRSFLAGEPVAAGDPRLAGAGVRRPSCTTADDDGPPRPPLPAPVPAPAAAPPAPSGPAGAAGAPAPAPGPSPAPAAVVAPVTPSAPATPVPAAARPAAADTRRPVVRIAVPRCSRGRCTYTVRVTDPGISAGVRRVTATFSSSVTGRCATRRGICRRTVRRAVRITRRAAGAWVLVVRGVPAGRHTLRVAARDGAGLSSTATRRSRTSTGARR